MRTAGSYTTSGERKREYFYPPPLERLLRGLTFDKNGCWLYTAGTPSPDGYVRLRIDGRQWLAHRAMWTCIVGPVEADVVLDHFRLNPGSRNAPCSRICINPLHLELTSSLGNLKAADAGTMLNSPTKTHCAWGHEFNEVNTNFYTYRGVTLRRCRLCKSRRDKESKVRRGLTPGGRKLRLRSLNAARD